MAHRYACASYPGMDGCPWDITAATFEEVLKHTEAHAAEIHGDDPPNWSADERRQVEELIREV